MKDYLNERQPQLKMTFMEDDINGRQPQWKITSIKDNLNWRRLLWKTSLMEDDLEDYLNGRPEMKTSKGDDLKARRPQSETTQKEDDLKGRRNQRDTTLKGDDLNVKRRPQWKKKTSMEKKTPMEDGLNTRKPNWRTVNHFYITKISSAWAELGTDRPSLFFVIIIFWNCTAK